MKPILYWIACGVSLVPATLHAALEQSDIVGAVLMQKHLVPISDGRKMNLICVGTGKTTVVFESGLGSNVLNWQKIAGPISKFARTCFYDRAGYGYSDPPGRPSTAVNAAEDLHALLLSAGVTAPIILVGHSIGGLYATLYADRFFNEVAGLVLVEPSFAEQDRDEDAVTRAQDQLTFERNIMELRKCAVLARSGKLATEVHAECFAFAPDRTAEEKAFLFYQMIKPDRYEAMASESESQHSSDGKSDVNSLQEAAARQSFGNKPIVVLTAAPAVDSAQSDAERDSSERLWNSWRAGHDALAKRSSRGKSVVIPETGHFIQVDKPQAVIDAVKEVVESIGRETRERRQTGSR